jgi:hypothetical protein
VVVVDLEVGLRAEDMEHLGDHDVAPRVRVAAGEPHRLRVRLAVRRVRGEYDRRRHHRALVCAAVERQPLRECEEARRGLVAEAARAEVHADPDPVVLLVAEQVDVVIPGADRAELLPGEAGERALRLEPGVPDLLDHRVVARAPVVAPDAERDPPEDLVHDPRQVVLDVGEGQVGARGLVAAGNVEADSGRGDVAAVGDHAADRHGVAEVAVGAEHALRALLGRDAVLELRDRCRVVLSEDPDGHGSDRTGGTNSSE